MELHADLGRRALVRGAELDWVPSPLAGVERRMLERDGEEVARATSIVRYVPGSSFSEHVHGGGEELLVLEGTFADAGGAYSEGTYVRNPPGSRHAPWSEEGCILLVKLRQMGPDETERVVVDATAADWRRAPGTELEELPLFSGATERVSLLRLGSGAELELESEAGGAELFVVDGELAVGDDLHPRWTWLRDAAGIEAPLRARGDCTVYLKRGHLPPPAG
jgi:hypothetical protein